MGNPLPSIPAKRYFTIGEVAELCCVKPHVLRYWEQEFTQLRPMKRRGNRRYYQHHEVLMIRRIRDLLYDQGFTISGARNRLQELAHGSRPSDGEGDQDFTDSLPSGIPINGLQDLMIGTRELAFDSHAVRKELFEIRALLSPG
ncbi:MAG: MerR family transcriptional regulator [Acidovorax sp.]|jgi:DNA-binding transcriptional MerR regulator